MTINISDKKIKNLFYIFLVFTLALTLVAFWMGGSKENVNTTCEICKPTTMQKLADGVDEFTFVPKKYPMELNTIAFFTSHQFVEIYEGKKLIYSFDTDAGILGHTTGTAWHFIPVGDGVEEITVRLTPAYKSGEYQKCTFYCGSEMDIFIYLFRRALPSFLASVIILILGIALIVLSRIVGKCGYTGQSFLYLGIFSTLFGIWSANETDIVTLLCKNRVGSYFLAYVALMLMVIPFIFFVREFFRVGENKIWKFFAVSNILEMMTVLALQFFGIRDLRETLFLTHIFLAIGIGYLIGCVLYKIIRNKADKRVRATIFSGVLIVAAVVIDIYAYYYRIGDADLFGRFVFLLFIVTVSFETISETLIMIEKGKKAAEYQKLADTDALTGLKSRSSYERDVQHQASHDTMIISFDLNNLKKCNDRYGHKMGDEYIVSSSRIIKKAFSRYGKVYRIGGDEFVCIVPHSGKCPIDKCLKQMQEEVTKYNSAGTQYYGFVMQIACGYAVYNPLTDENLEATRNRSDFMMYQNKSALKENKE